MTNSQSLDREEWYGMKTAWVNRASDLDHILSKRRRIFGEVDDVQIFQVGGSVPRSFLREESVSKYRGHSF